MSLALQEEDKAQAYDRIVNDKWTEFLDDLGYSGTKQEYIDYIIEDIIPEL